MAMKTTRPTDNLSLPGVINPGSQGAGTVNSGWVSLADLNTVIATIFVGTMAAGATLDAKIEQATDAAGTGAKDVTGKAITQMTQAGGDSDKQRVIEVDGEDLDVDNDFTHVRLAVTVAVAAVDLSAAVQGVDERFGGAQKHNLASLDEIIGLDA